MGNKLKYQQIAIIILNSMRNVSWWVSFISTLLNFQFTLVLMSSYAVTKDNLKQELKISESFFGPYNDINRYSRNAQADCKIFRKPLLNVFTFEKAEFR